MCGGLVTHEHLKKPLWDILCKLLLRINIRILIKKKLTETVKGWLQQTPEVFYICILDGHQLQYHICTYYNQEECHTIGAQKMHDSFFTVYCCVIMFRKLNVVKLI